MAKISIVRLSDVLDEQRLDAEYYLPEYTSLIETLLKLQKKEKTTVLLLSDRRITKKFIKSMIIGRRTECYSRKGPPFIRVSDIRELSVDLSEIAHLNLKIAKNLRGLAKGRPDEVLVSKSGTIASIGVIPEEYDQWYLSDDLICLRTNINPYYLATFLESRYGKLQILRGKTQQVQMKVSIQNLKRLMVFVPPIDFQLEIERIVKLANEKRKLAREKYQQAEDLIYKTLSLSRKEIEEMGKEKAYETYFEEVKSSFRFDAGYYHPKYFRIVELLKNIPFKTAKLESRVEISENTIDPTKAAAHRAATFRYIPIARFEDGGEVIEWEELRGWQAPSRARKIIKEHDLLVPSLAGTFKKIVLVPKELDGELTTTGCFVVRAKSDHPEFLFLLFRTPLFQRQLERQTTGTIMSAVPKKAFRNLIIPVIPKTKQRPITKYVKDYFELRARARQLIYQAVLKVEEMIQNASRNEML